MKKQNAKVESILPFELSFCIEWINIQIFSKSWEEKQRRVLAHFCLASPVNPLSTSGEGKKRGEVKGNKASTQRGAFTEF